MNQDKQKKDEQERQNQIKNRRWIPSIRIWTWTVSSSSYAVGDSTQQWWVFHLKDATKTLI